MKYMFKKKFRSQTDIHEANAYLTLEASLIMPFVLMILVFLIYTGFYYYDKCLLQQDAYRIMIRGSQMRFMTNEEVAQKLLNDDLNLNDDKYVMCVVADKRIGVDYNSISVEQQAMLRAAYPSIFRTTGNNVWEMNFRKVAVRIHPVETIRSFRKIENIIERENN